MQNAGRFARQAYAFGDDRMTVRRPAKLAALTAFLITALPVQAALGDIMRSCSAGYQIKLTGAGFDTITRDIVVGTFSARRGCGNVAVADRCRRRARDGAHKCMRQHWDSAGGRPSICDDRGGEGVRGYPEAWARMGPREAARIEALALCNFLSGAPAGNSRAGFCSSSTRVTVYATTRGNSGCKKTVELGTLDVGEDALENGNFSVHTRLVRPDIAGSSKDGQVIADRTFSYSHRSGGKLKTYSARSTVFSEFNRDKRRQTPYSPHYNDYYGCGRHAAQHMMDWLRRPRPDISFSEVRNAVRAVTDRTSDLKLDPATHAAVKGTLLKLFDGQIAVLPLDLRRGMNALLRNNGLGVRYRAISHQNTRDPQGFMLRTVARSSPVVALIRDGSHWVTVMGYWQPLLSKPGSGYFYHMNNGVADMNHWSHFDLKFGTAITAVSAVIPSYNEGTMITWAKR